MATAADARAQEAWSIGCLLAASALAQTDAPALLDSAGQAQAYDKLPGLVDAVVAQLNRAGIGRHDRVAIVLPNGPEMALAFLAVASGATAAPLNPGYSPAEFDFYLRDLGARAVIVPSGVATSVPAVARSLGVAMLELLPRGNGTAGLFDLDLGGAQVGHLRTGGLAEPEDVALILHTSGTTSRPKVVPLTHANLCASAYHIRDWLGLTPADRTLNVMPLFHVHGLVGALLASLAAGAGVIATPGFAPDRFLQWLDRLNPTWYTAVPTMHQAVLAEARQDLQAAGRHRLRFVRSCSSALPPQVKEELEAVFGVPVVEAYGMTEAAHQMTCNPLPPGERKPGSVGLPTGTEVAIMGDDGTLRPPGQVGEVVVKGPNVVSGYENNPGANASSFRGGWFLTGDLGYRDPDGYLYLTGRAKEIINRGGEKISPREVDEVLLDHPAVAQAVAFALPHPTLGEEVAAAIVLRPRMAADETELRQHAAARLAPFKVPRKVVILSEIPKGPTGKIQRIGLADKLGLLGAADGRTGSDFVAPRNRVEETLAGIWAKVLGVDRVGVCDDFADLGGDSLSAVSIIAATSRTFGVDLPLSAFATTGTVEEMAKVVTSALGDVDRGLPAERLLVPLRAEGKGAPLVLVHDLSGQVFFYHSLARLLSSDRPVYGLQAQGLSGGDPCDRLDVMLDRYVFELRELQPRGPYFLAGYCSGGLLALELARLLLAAGERVAFLGLVETRRPVAGLPGGTRGWLRRSVLVRLGQHFLNLVSLAPAERKAYVAQRLGVLGYRVRGALGRRVPRLADTQTLAGLRVLRATQRALNDYRPDHYPAKMTVFYAEQRLGDDESLGWAGHAADLEVCRVPGTHWSIIHSSAVGGLAEKLNNSLNSAGSAG